MASLNDVVESLHLKLLTGSDAEPYSRYLAHAALGQSHDLRSYVGDDWAPFTNFTPDPWPKVQALPKAA
jgi:hypothetical protein